MITVLAGLCSANFFVASADQAQSASPSCTTAAAATVARMVASTMPNTTCGITVRSRVRPTPDHGRRSAWRRSTNTKPSALTVTPTPAAACEITTGNRAVATWMIPPMSSTQPKNPSQANAIREASLGRPSWPRNTRDDVVFDLMSIPNMAANTTHRGHPITQPDRPDVLAPHPARHRGRTRLHLKQPRTGR